MKSMIELSFGFLLILMIASCASKNYSIAPEYRNLKIGGGSLVIPTIDKINIGQSAELFEQKELDAIEKEYFRFLSQNLKDRITAASSFESVNYVELKNKPLFNTQKFELKDGETIYLDVPEKPLEINKSLGAFVLFIESAGLNITAEPKETSDPAKHFSVEATNTRDIKVSNAKALDHFFVFEIKYLIYDNAVGKPVAYGLITQKERYESQKNVEAMFTRTVNKIAEIIIKGSPFEK